MTDDKMQFIEHAYWTARKVLEMADDTLVSPHPLWAELNELSEVLLWAERLLEIPNRYEPNHYSKKLNA